MDIVGFNGSARTDCDIAILVEAVVAELKREGIETGLVQLARKRIRGPPPRVRCEPDRRCAVRDDLPDDRIEEMLEADGIILVSPRYCADVSPG